MIFLLFVVIVTYPSYTFSFSSHWLVMLVMAVGHAFRPLLILSMFCNIVRGFCLFNESLSNEITPEYFYLSKFLSTPPNYESIG